MSSAPSFANIVKNELARVVGHKNCCQAAELASLMRMGGTMVIGGNRNLGINFSTENAAVARKALSLIKQGFQLNTQVVVTRAKRLKKNNSYHLKVLPAPAVRDFLEAIGIFRSESLHRGTDHGTFRKICCRKAYIRGAFLGGGSVSRPESEYHLELVTANEEHAKTLVKLLKYFQLSAKLTDRKEVHIVYMKEGEAILAFLRLIGAEESAKAFADVRQVKEMRNQVNRLVNCETANLQKTVNAAFRQTERIKVIARLQGLATLPKSLRQAAEVRLAYPEATLNELVDVLGGTVGKSGMNHRLRKLEQIAVELEQGEQLGEEEI